MKRSTILVMSLVVFFNQAALGGRAQRHYKFVGSVVGYDQLLSLTNITSAPQLQVLIVNIGKEGKPARYIRVNYKYGHSKSALPDALFDENAKWRFILKRDRGCDTLLRDLKTQTTTDGALPRYKFAKELENRSEDTSLPCYALAPDGLRKVDD